LSGMIQYSNYMYETFILNKLKMKKMEKKRSIITGSLFAGALMTVTGFTANAGSMFNFNSLGSGEEVRANLLERESGARNFELKCGEKKADSTSMKKGKDGKCGEGKCGDKKAKKAKKGKDGKCGEGKCGDSKKG